MADLQKLEIFIDRAQAIPPANAIGLRYDSSVPALLITTEEAGANAASAVSYDASNSGLGSDDVQGAVDELSTLVSSLQSAPPSDRTGLVNGGQVVWEGNLDFRVSAAAYYIAGTLYSSAEQTITLDASDPTDARIDVIALDTTETVVKISGTPAPPPGEPSIDPETQLKLVLVTIPAAATEPELVNTTIYLEGAGGEWTDSSSGSGWTLDSTNNPRTGTKCEEATNVAANAYLQWQTGTAFDLTTVQQLVFYIRSKATWAAAKMLRIRFQSTGILQGVEVTLKDGYWGFNSAQTGVYQQVAIPISQFQVPVTFTVNQLRMTVLGGGGSIGFYLDDIFLQAGLESAAPLIPYASTTVPGIVELATDGESAANLAVQANDSRLGFNGSLSVDDTYSGIRITLTAAATTAQWEVGYLNSASKVALADADALATSGALFLATAAISADASGVYLVHGTARNNAWNWTPGGLIYLSLTPGGMTQTAPSATDDVIQVLGVALTADIILWNPQLVQVVHA